MLARIEDNLIKRLRDCLPATVDVAPLPDVPTELDRPFPHGQILVYFAGLHGKPQPDSSARCESRRTVWQLLFRHRGRRKAGALYGLIDAATVLLVGYLPAGAQSRITLAEISAPEVLDNVWTAFMTISCDVPVVPYMEPETAAKLARASFENVPDGTSPMEKS